jgi:phosphate acetyl/butyryl transferase
MLESAGGYRGVTALGGLSPSRRMYRVELALCTAEAARRFGVVPRVAMLSFSSFGSTAHPQCEKVRKAVGLLHEADPALIVDGQIMADAAVSPERGWPGPCIYCPGRRK